MVRVCPGVVGVVLVGQRLGVDRWTRTSVFSRSILLTTLGTNYLELAYDKQSIVFLKSVVVVVVAPVSGDDYNISKLTPCQRALGVLSIQHVDSNSKRVGAVNTCVVWRSFLCSR